MKKLALLIAALALMVSAQAQSLKVSTGGSAGSYSRMFKELSNVCVNEIQLVEMNSSGSMQNIDRITGNEANAAFVQTDVLFFRGRTEDLSNIKTLVTMHPEEVHVVALTDSKQKEGGTLGFGAKAVQLNSVTDLANRVVAAGGGSYITAQVIRLQTEIPFQVVEAKNSADALAMVTSGQASAAILVGGAPLGDLTPLGREYKLLNFSEATMGKLKNVYKPAKLNYSKMTASTGVQTIATDAVWVTREYKTPKFIGGLSKLRTCINKNVPVLAEEIGMHPAWSKVKVGEQSKWPMLDLKK